MPGVLTLAARAVQSFTVRFCSNSLPCSDLMVCGETGFVTRSSGALAAATRSTGSVSAATRSAGALTLNTRGSSSLTLTVR